MKGDSTAFIATQGPLKNSIDDFWTMVINENVDLILMLCKFYAKDRVLICQINNIYKIY